MTEQSSPTTSPHSEVVNSNHLSESVRREMNSRAVEGYKRYGSLLKTFNGRDAIRDLREELLDAIVYTEQIRLEDQAKTDAVCNFLDEWSVDPADDSWVPLFNTMSELFGHPRRLPVA